MTVPGLHDPRTFQIIGAAMEVHRILHRGLLEQIYCEAIAVEFELRSIPFASQVPCQIVLCLISGGTRQPREDSHRFKRRCDTDPTGVTRFRYSTWLRRPCQPMGLPFSSAIEVTAKQTTRDRVRIRLT